MEIQFTTDGHWTKADVDRGVQYCWTDLEPEECASRGGSTRVYYSPSLNVTRVWITGLQDHDDAVDLSRCLASFDSVWGVKLDGRTIHG